MIRDRHLNFTLVTVRFYYLIYSLEQGNIFSELDVTDTTQILILLYPVECKLKFSFFIFKK